MNRSWGGGVRSHWPAAGGAGSPAAGSGPQRRGYPDPCPAPGNGDHTAGPGGEPSTSTAGDSMRHRRNDPEELRSPRRFEVRSLLELPNNLRQNLPGSSLRLSPQVLGPQPTQVRRVELLAADQVQFFDRLRQATEQACPIKNPRATVTKIGAIDPMLIMKAAENV